MDKNKYNWNEYKEYNNIDLIIQNKNQLQNQKNKNLI